MLPYHYKKYFKKLARKQTNKFYLPACTFEIDFPLLVIFPIDEKCSLLNISTEAAIQNYNVKFDISI